MKKISLLIFYITILFIIIPKNAQALNGIDVSEFQGNIDFNAVKNDGIDIVYIRSSASFSYVDSQFKNNYEKAKNANLKIGFYHYVTARTKEEAETQARFFASVIKNTSPDCLLAMDFERFPDLTKEEINSISLAFLSTLEEVTSKKALIYSDAYNADNTFNAELFKDYPLWVAQYEVAKPETKIPYIGWQYTDKGRVSGIEGNVDRDEFDASIFLDDNTPIKEPDLKPEEKTKTIFYRVLKGDTLYGIAHEYKTSIYALVKENNIRNPNLIYPNEILKITIPYNYPITRTGNNEIYTVKRGDTLTKIANIYHVTISNLVSWNNIKNPNLIYPNEKIIIKSLNNTNLIKYEIKNNTTLDNIAKSYYVSIYELKQINKNIKYNLTPGDIIYIPESYIY